MALIEIFILKIYANCCGFLAFGVFAAGVTWKIRRICSSLFSYDLLTTDTYSLVDAEVGRNCELL